MEWRAGLAALCMAGAMGLGGVAHAGPARADFGNHVPSHDARQLAQWVVDSGDARGRPWIVVDKRDARLYAFGADGRLVATTAVLLGSAPGDHTVPGVGQRAQTGQIAAHERTTPAGRFVTHPGRNLDGEHVVWFDYGAALSIHRLRPGAAHAVREKRLATPTPADNRASLGCIVVPVAFYMDVVEPLLGRGRGIAYVLPETQPARELFNSM